MTTKQENKNRSRLIYLVLLGMIPLLWAMISAWQMYSTGAIMYIIMGCLGIAGLIFLPKLGIKNVRGIDNNIWTDIFIGIGEGLFFIFLSVLNFVGSIPIVQVSDFALRVIGSGIYESLIFYVLMIPLIYHAFKKENPKNDLIVFIICGILFAGFHIAVLASGGNPLSAVWGFITSATIIGVIWGYTLKITKSATPLIISHSMLNGWILNNQYHWINFGNIFGQTSSVILPLIHNLIPLINILH